MKEQLNALRERALTELQTLNDPKAMEEFRVRLLGKKGEVTALLRGMGAVPAEERPAMGQLINSLRAELEEALSEALKSGHGYVIDCAIFMDEMVRPMVGGGSHITEFMIN